MMTATGHNDPAIAIPSSPDAPARENSRDVDAEGARAARADGGTELGRGRLVMLDLVPITVLGGS
jgi:hypothetical protein